jgi:flagellar biosynthesis protein FlhA
MQLKPGEYRILLKGNEVARGDLMRDHYLAMNPGGEVGSVKGVPTVEPTYGIEALWIKEQHREEAIAKGYTVVDLATVMTTHLSDIIRKHAYELIGRQEVQSLLDTLKETHPKVVEELVPNQMSLGGVVKVMQNLLAEQVPVRDFLTVVEAIADWAPTIKNLDQLTEYVRQALFRTITKQYQTEAGDVMVISLAQPLERKIAESIERTEQGEFLAIEPPVAQLMMQKLAVQLEKFAPLNLQPVVLCSTQIRLHFKKLVDRFIPNLTVLSYDEIMANVKIQSIGVVELSNED